MSNPLDKIKKLKGRSWEEIRTRSEQTLAVYSEQIGLSGKLPTDNELTELLDKSLFKEKFINPETLYNKFYENSLTAFFPSFAEKEKTIELYRRFFGDQSAHVFIEKADQIIEGRVDVLGYKHLNFGADVDWHFEPVANKRSPLKHWKHFDEIDASETGDKKIIWELNRHQHFFTLGVAFWLTGDERYAAAFVRQLDGWMRQNSPGMGINWFSSLEIALRSISWIWSFHFFKDSVNFTPAFFQRAVKFLYLHGRHIEKYLSTFYSPNTHLTGEALGLYYLGTQLPFFEQSARWRFLGEEILFAELDRQILPDGVYFEQTTWYQRYTADFYSHFLILKILSNSNQADEHLQQKLETKLQSALDFMMYVTQPDGTTPLVGDDDGGRMLPLSNAQCDDFRGTLAVGAVLFERGDYKFVAREMTEEIIWLMGLEGVLSFETIAPKKPENASAKFSDGGYFVMRDGWTETDNYLLIDADSLASLTGGHAHADSLSINMAVGGRTMLVDSGTYTYHESKESRDYFRSSAAHNVLTIDKNSSSEPGEKFSWQTKAETKTHAWISDIRFDYFEASHNGYERFEENPARHTRSILFLKNDYWIMRDFVETAGQHDYQLNFHFNLGTNPAIETAENGNSCVSEIQSDDVGLRLFTFGDNGEWQHSQDWMSRCYGKRDLAPLLQFASKGTGAQEFFTFALPTDELASKPEVFETEVEGGRAFAVKYRGYWDLFVFADVVRQMVRTEFFNTNFQFSWARLSAADEMPEEFVLIGGTQFSIGSREIINHPKRLNFAAARRFGSKLNVRTGESIFSVSLPQNRTI